MKKYISLLKYLIIKNKFNFFIILIFFNSAEANLSNFKEERKDDINTYKTKIAEGNWELNDSIKNSLVEWNYLSEDETEDMISIFNKDEYDNSRKETKLNSLNRSIVFNNDIVGPDISWIIPPGFSWNKKYKFDMNARGHNTQIPDPPNKTFFGWNDGDAVGLISYQFLNLPQSSLGINIGVRSLYQGSGASGGQSPLGDGISLGFRWDHELSSDAGFAFGAEQLVHLDNITDTGRNIYLTASKGWWSSKYEGTGIYPLYVATGGIATGRMAVGNVKRLCTDLLEDGIDINAHGRLCWAPVFSLAGVWNEKTSTFFEYNGRFFLIGTSFVPSQKVPLRGSFALILSDHIDNYKVHDASEMNWVFNLSLGF